MICVIYEQKLKEPIHDLPHPDFNVSVIMIHVSRWNAVNLVDNVEQSSPNLYLTSIVSNSFMLCQTNEIMELFVAAAKPSLYCFIRIWQLVAESMSRRTC